MSVQRLRVRFRKGERLRYISHLDVLRHWERALRRAGIPLSYSQGFTPHPKITFAAPLPLGFVSEAELMDVLLDDRVDPKDFRERVSRQTPPDLAILEVREVGLSLPALQSLVEWADYEVDLAGVTREEVEAAGRAFLAAERWVVLDERKDRPREVDIRPGVAWLRVTEGPCGLVRLTMRLRASQQLTVRPELVVGAVAPGARTERIARVGLQLREASPAIEAWKTRGEFA